MLKENWFLDIRNGDVILYNEDTRRWHLEKNPNFYLRIPMNQTEEVIQLLKKVKE